MTSKKQAIACCCCCYCCCCCCCCCLLPAAAAAAAAAATTAAAAAAAAAAAVAAAAAAKHCVAQAKLQIGTDNYWSKDYRQGSPNKQDGSEVLAAFSNKEGQKLCRLKMVWWGMLQGQRLDAEQKKAPLFRLWKAKKPQTEATSKKVAGAGSRAIKIAHFTIHQNSALAKQEQSSQQQKQQQQQQQHQQ